MKLKNAPLKIANFLVLDSTFKFNDPDEGVAIDIADIFENYPIEFDFTAKEQENGEIFLYTKIGINNPENGNVLPGYVIYVEGLSILDFDQNIGLSKKEKHDYVFMSGLSIAINNLRAYISNLSCYYPFGRYQLPAIDMVQLHKDKSDLVKKNKRK